MSLNPTDERSDEERNPFAAVGPRRHRSKGGDHLTAVVTQPTSTDKALTAAATAAAADGNDEDDCGNGNDGSIRGYLC